MPELQHGKLWPIQFSAMTNLEKSFANNRPRSLILMTMGSGTKVCSKKVPRKALKERALTPRELIKAIVDWIEPTPDDTVFDPG